MITYSASIFITVDFLVISCALPSIASAENHSVIGFLGDASSVPTGGNLLLCLGS